jgi:hypothetical protein
MLNDASQYFITFPIKAFKYHIKRFNKRKFLLFRPTRIRA